MTIVPCQEGFTGDAVGSSIAAACAGAKVVSFDVFDTLFYRLAPEPETVFDLVGERFGIFGFRDVRMKAQVAAFAAMAVADGAVTFDTRLPLYASIAVSVLALAGAVTFTLRYPARAAKTLPPPA